MLVIYVKMTRYLWFCCEERKHNVIFKFCVSSWSFSGRVYRIKSNWYDVNWGRICLQIECKKLDAKQKFEIHWKPKFWSFPFFNFLFCYSLANDRVTSKNFSPNINLHVQFEHNIQTTAIFNETPSKNSCTFPYKRLPTLEHYPSEQKKSFLSIKSECSNKWNLSGKPWIGNIVYHFTAILKTNHIISSIYYHKTK